EHVVVDPASELGAEGPLAVGGPQDEADRLLDLALLRHHRDPPTRVDPQRERPARADELLAHCILTPSQPPMSTVAAEPTSWPGSPRHMRHWPPVFAAGFPSISTVALPATTRPCCVGGPMKGSEACRPTCGGVLIPEDPTTAAGLPPIRVLVARPMSSGA